MKLMVIPGLVGALLVSGCVSTAVGLATAPVRVASKVVDLTTTSQAEADRNRGRDMRHAEARERRQQRARVKQCHGSPECRDATDVRAARTD